MFDFIIFGASGFTGRYAVLEAVKLLDGYNWAVAGRSKTKLEEMLKEIGDKAGKSLQEIPIIIADVNDMESLVQMAESCKVLINTCGPYRLYGEAVIKACINSGTHQVDVCGEPEYMERIFLNYNDQAKNSNSLIVSACGFDSIPADLGVVFLEKHFDGTVNSVEEYVSMTSGSYGTLLNSGTWDSAVHGIANAAELGKLRKKINEAKEKLPKFEPKMKTQPNIHEQKNINKWCIPFLGSDASVVNRSQIFFYETEKKRPVQIKAYLATSSFIQTLLLTLLSYVLMYMTKFKVGQKLLLEYPQIFSGGLFSKEGPTEEKMKKTKFTLDLFGKGWAQELPEPTSNPGTPDRSIHVRVSSQNPGYGFTCVALLLSAINLLTSAERIPLKGGVLTPAAAFAKTDLIDQLCQNGTQFEVIAGYTKKNN